MEKRKLTTTKRAGFSGNLGTGGAADALVKVKQPNYVPPGISVRSRVSPLIFTVGNVNDVIVQLLENDINVISFSLNKQMNQIK
ncbi:MAG: hypothetical protein J7621_20965 [Niastella sp.]|nr:hypothetical protein [Niastella sp.]